MNARFDTDGNLVGYAGPFFDIGDTDVFNTMRYLGDFKDSANPADPDMAERDGIPRRYVQWALWGVR